MVSKYCSEECRKAAKAEMRKNPVAPRCIVCGAEFVRNSGRQSLCGGEDCTEKYKLQYHSKYRDDNRERLNAEARAAHHRRMAEDPDRVREHGRKYRAKNRDILNAKKRTPHARKVAADRLRNKVANDNQLRLNVRMGANIYHALAEKKAGRRWEDVVGYTVDELAEHLERQFVKGMTWDNWGRGADCWHIDHIVPKASFKFDNDNDPEFKACWGLHNLRPLWEKDNFAKSDNITHLI